MIAKWVLHDYAMLKGKPPQEILSQRFGAVLCIIKAFNNHHLLGTLLPFSTSFDIEPPIKILFRVSTGIAPIVGWYVPAYI